MVCYRFCKFLIFYCIILLNISLLANTNIPFNNDTLNYTHVLFAWDQEPGAAAYQLQVAVDDTTGGIDPFDTLIVVDLIDSTLLTIVTDSLVWDQSYLWRIRKINQSGATGTWTEPSHFTTEPLPSDIPDMIVTINDTAAYRPGLTMVNLTRKAIMMALDIHGNTVFFIAQDPTVTRNIHLAEILPNGNFLTTPYEITLDNQVVWEPPENIHHGIIAMPNGNFMALSRAEQFGYIPVGPWSADFDSAGIDSILWKGDVLYEWDHNGNEVWSWSVFDHFNMLDYDSTAFALAFNAGSYDWTHSNALYYDPVESAVYISVRQLSRITKIDYATGAVVWNMGEAMPSGDVQVGNDLGFSWQHAIEMLDNRNLILYDNGNTNSPQVSRGIEIALTETDSVPTAELVWEYVLPDSLYTRSQGDCDRLANGNSLITAANPTNNIYNAHIIEVNTTTNDIIWQLRFGENGTRNMYASERIPGIYAKAFSVIQPDLATGFSEPTIFKEEGNSYLKFYIFNEGFMGETFAYSVIDSYGWFSGSGEVTLAAEDSASIIIIGSVNYDIYPNIVQITVTPEGAPALEVQYQYDVYSTPNTATVNDFLPTGYKFDAAYPNPFNPITNLQYATPAVGHITLTIYDISGREVVVLVNEEQPAGFHNVAWNARRSASGIYFARLQANGFTEKQKIILLK